MPDHHFKRSKLGVCGFRQISRLYATDLIASSTARLTGVSVPSVNDIYLRLRTRLAYECEERRPIRPGEGRGRRERLRGETIGDAAPAARRSTSGEGKMGSHFCLDPPFVRRVSGGVSGRPPGILRGGGNGLDTPAVGPDFPSGVN